MLKRIIRFQSHDWKHILWLIKRILLGYWNGNAELIVNSWLLLRFHIENDSVLIVKAPPASEEVEE